jgi:large subunit ribosomal protein L5
MSIDLANIQSNLQSELKKTNISSLPKLIKVVLNYRIADSRDSQEALAQAQTELEAISGQKPKLCRSKKAVASFKLRQNEPLAYQVTLRGQRMYDFITTLFNLVLPRLRDFKGLPVNAFDDQGNYNLTIKDQTYFPQIDLDKINKIRPLQITFTISSSSKSESKMLLSALGLAFQK